MKPIVLFWLYTSNHWLYLSSHRQQTHCCQVVNVPLAGDKAEVEMSKQGIRALIISAVIGLIFWVLFIICIAGVIYG
nr:MAG TPA_asm: glycoprotein [Caudoviricetes sp.]